MVPGSPDSLTGVVLARTQHRDTAGLQEGTEASL